MIICENAVAGVSIFRLGHLGTKDMGATVAPPVDAVAGGAEVAFSGEFVTLGGTAFGTRHRFPLVKHPVTTITTPSRSNKLNTRPMFISANITRVIAPHPQPAQGPTTDTLVRSCR
jgi:hypothetical protein